MLALHPQLFCTNQLLPLNDTLFDFDPHVSYPLPPLCDCDHTYDYHHPGAHPKCPMPADYDPRNWRDRYL